MEPVVANSAISEPVEHRALGRASLARGGGPLRLPLQPKHRATLGFDLLRVYLGTALSVRGALLLASPEWLGATLGASAPPMGTVWALGLVHLAGGLLLAAGYHTRLAAISQLVPVVGALWVHGRVDLASPNQSPELVGLLTVALVGMALFGAGPWSLDHAGKKWRLSKPRSNSGYTG